MISTIQQHLNNARIHEALDLAMLVFPQRKTELAMIQSRYYTLQWNEHYGLMATEDISITRQQLQTALISICEEEGGELSIDMSISVQPKVSYLTY